MQTKTLLPLVLLMLGAAPAVAQENTGQMGTTAQPSATTEKTPANSKQDAAAQKQAAPAPPTTPATPAVKAKNPGESTEVAKPESSAPSSSATPASAAKAPSRLPAAASSGLSMNIANAAELQQKIEGALRNDMSLTGTQLTVNISDDAIDLSGNAASNRQRLAARRIVQSFAGNRLVRERITVPGSAGSSAKNAPAVLPEHTALPAGAPAPAAAPAQAPAKEPGQDANRPVTDPSKDGDKSEHPR